MAESRKLVLQSSAFLRKLAADVDDDAESDGYEIGDGEDSGYTEIPMEVAGCGGGGDAGGGGGGGLRDRVARFVFRSSSSKQQPQPPQQPQQPSRRRQGEFADYAYTRWAFQLPTSAQLAPSKSVSAARTVRFRCPYEDATSSSSVPTVAAAAAAAAAATESALVRPYSTRAFVCQPTPPLPQPPPSGERSASSGYGSDVDGASSASPGVVGSVGDNWAVREEDIDRLLLVGSRRHHRRPQPQPPLLPPTTATMTTPAWASPRPSPRQPPPTPALPGDADELDVSSLDLAAYFPPTAASPAQIDRIVGDVVRLKAAVRQPPSQPQSPASGVRRGGGHCGGSPWGQRQCRRGLGAPVAASAGMEMADLRPLPHSYDRPSYCQ